MGIERIKGAIPRFALRLRRIYWISTGVEMPTGMGDRKMTWEQLSVVSDHANVSSVTIVPNEETHSFPINTKILNER